MRKYLPIFSEVFNIHPWHFGGEPRLYTEEILEYFKHLKAKADANKQGAGDAKYGRRGRATRRPPVRRRG